MREWFQNVYQGDESGSQKLGLTVFETRQEARKFTASAAVFRIHVRLKPEGAPRRYRDDYQRQAWEWAERAGMTPRYD